MKNKPICLVLGLLLCLCCAALAQQEDWTRCYTSGEWTYILLEDGTAEIIHCDEMAQELIIPAELDGYRVTSIGEKGCAYTPLLTSITIPDSVTSIGDRAFEFCSSLTSITIPNSVTSIGDRAFGACASLTSITIPDSVLIIGVNPFENCPKLTDIWVSPDHPTLATIDGVLFEKTEKRLVCYPCAILAESYRIPQGIRAIGESAFWGCSSLSSVIISDSVTEIAQSAFAGCRGITSFHIGSGVTDLPFLGDLDEWFGRCRTYLENNWYVPPATGSNNPFVLMPELTSVTVSAENPVYFIRDDMLLRRGAQAEDMGTPDEDELIYLVYCPMWKMGDITVPAEVDVIGADAFCGCRIDMLLLTDNVKEIAGEAFSFAEQIAVLCVPDSVACLNDGALAGPIGRIRLPENMQAECIMRAAVKRSEDYIYPDAITEERMQGFLEKASTQKEKRAITDLYKKIDPRQYGRRDNSEELEATYPVLKEGTVIYVLRRAKADEKNRSVLAKNEKSFAAVGYTAEDLKLDYLLTRGHEMPVEYRFPYEVISSQLERLGIPMSAELENLPEGLAVVWALQRGNTVLNPPEFIHTLQEDGTVCIWVYLGESSTVTIPAMLDGLPVTAIGDGAFSFGRNVTSVIIPASVTSIGADAFAACSATLTLTVHRNSYARQYAIDNGIRYIYPDANDWLNQ